MEKTHWLSSPNKNYLGHWDLPEAKDLILTIASAQFEEVKNPITHQSDAKKVIRWKENYKPFIVNATNANSIIKSTGQKYLEDSIGCKIALYISQTKVMGDLVDCIRVRPKLPKNDPVKNKPSISNTRFDNALKAIKKGDYSKKELLNTYTLDKEQKTQLDAVN